MPPAPAAVKFAQRAEADGFDAIWWPDHLMGWHPDSLWTPDLTPLATAQANPHTYFDPLVMMGAIGAQTTRLRVGVVVTDLIRRHPAVLAQTMLTLDHLTEGRPSSVSARASSSTSRRTGCRGTSRWPGWPRASR
jgi:phthiodiolone/phenolphthiodiolone dimycocerosates ketoreductase